MNPEIAGSTKMERAQVRLKYPIPVNSSTRSPSKRSPK